MMQQIDKFKKDLLRVVVFALLSLFALPVITLVFSQYAEADRDHFYVQRVSAAIEQDNSLSVAAKQQAKQNFTNHTPSTICDSSDPGDTKYREAVCATYSELWQYHVAEKIAWWSIVIGVGVLIAICGLGALAFANRRAQYVSFVIGWNLLRVVSAGTVIVQGTLLVWLSFWLTAFFFQRYVVKLILIAAVVAGGAAISAILGIFKRPPRDTGLQGELVTERDAPLLWNNLRAFAKRVGTSAPDHVVAGIDANFFVTEAPLTVGNQTLTGRCLFVSLPLLRILDRNEAGAVLAHELAHLMGGDTASSAMLGPKLVQYDHYCYLMRSGGATIAIFHLIYLYRIIFEIALRSDSRRREFSADAVAAKLVSGSAIATSLIKIAAYSGYRSQVEGKLFEHDTRHENDIGIGKQVSAGLSPYALSASFTDMMQTANVPHPFDSHPPLNERMQNVDVQIPTEQFGSIVSTVPQTTWANDIPTADSIEQRLWAAYEQHFAQQHELSLAYRYLPANDAERAVVEKHFPPVAFSLKRNQQIEITCDAMKLPEKDELCPWSCVADIKYTDGWGSDVLEIIHYDKGLFGRKSTKVKLRGISKRRAQFKQALGNYWHRYRTAQSQG